ncbi:DUF3397 domain-containing protein [Geomicrobium sediminis]|nr:DUF3397 domain-containing protein [Geomicrobium sediminis]
MITLLTVLITFPLVVFLLLSVLLVRFMSNKTRALKIAADCSVPFFFFAVMMIWYELFTIGFIWIALVFLFIGMWLTFAQWKKFGDLYGRKLFTAIWRTYFIVLVPMYVTLLCIGILSSVTTYFIA